MIAVRHAVRHLVKRPGFTVSMLIILAVGIGANTAIYSVVRSVVLAPLPFPESERLIRIVGTTDDGGELRQSGVFPRHFDELRRRSRTLEALTAQRFRNLMLLPGDGEPQRVTGTGVTAGWARTLGVRPLLGRTFEPEEYLAGSDADVAIISHGLWHRQFAGDVAALGRTLRLNHREYTVIGVMPQQFNFPYGSDVWLPLTIDPAVGAPGDLNVPARVRPEFTPEQAIAELESLGRQISSGAVGDDRRGLTARSFAEEFPRDPNNAIAALAAAVAFLLLLVCVNAANLQLARAAGRTREAAMRTALGARRIHLVRDLLAESLLLAVAAAAIGIGIALLVRDWLVLLVPPRLGEVVQSVGLDSGVFVFAAVVAIAAAVAVGFAPAWRVSGVAPAVALKSSGHGASFGGRWMRPLVVAQVALAFILLTGAGLMAQDFARLSLAAVGYDPAGLYRVGIGLPEPVYDDPARLAAAVEQLVEQTGAVAGVDAAAVTNLHPVPRTNANIGARLLLPGMSPDDELPIVNRRMISPGYFATIGIRLLQGRGFELTDTAGAERVAIVSHRMAERFWPGESPLGKQLRLADGDIWHTVVGVVDEIAEPNFAPVGTLYWPYSQSADYQAPGLWSTTSVALMVRARGAPVQMLAEVRDAVWEVDRSLTVFDALPVTALLAEPLDGQRLGSTVLMAFGGFALLLALFGTYAVIRLSVTEREREFGIRLALGISPGRLRWMVIREGLVLAAAGLAAGVLCGLVLALPARRFLVEADPHDPAVSATVIVTLLAAALMACWLPARRASRVDPMTALRHE
ncbi:MAG TPA: ADOP family duplicated permease [Lysobacter sp.]|nr:ADOP family duplicated permease [Lysobacter sp.]